MLKNYLNQVWFIEMERKMETHKIEPNEILLFLNLNKSKASGLIIPTDIN
jgi:hypothetical protein